MAERKLQRSGRMADPHDQPGSEPDATTPEQSTPPEQKPPAKAAKKVPAKKAPAKKAAAKNAPAKSPAPAPPKPPAAPVSMRQLIESNGELAAAAKDAAAQAKSTVEDA